MTTEKLLLTPEETAHLLSISRRRVYELMRCGRIDSVKIGASRRVPRVAVDQFLAEVIAESGAA